MTKRGEPLRALPEIKVHDWRFVGGEYVTRAGGTFMTGQMYVERWVPVAHTRPYPVVMIHGGVQTGSNFIATPDGRPGWLHYFLAEGYEVLVVDQPSRGRSGHLVEDGKADGLTRYTAEHIQQRFTAAGKFALWPQAALQTEWPGTGEPGDPVFDSFFASQVEHLADRTEIERLNQVAGAALLDDIGEAILLTHSQSGPFGWLIADARPDKVKAIVALEPNGPPFFEVAFLGTETAGDDWYEYDLAPAREWGITRAPMTFDPLPDSASDLGPALASMPDSPDLVRGYLPSGPRRRLNRLAGIPILILSAEASYHACYDQCTSEFLDWAGVAHDFVRLEDRGIRGNGHMIMLEKNNHRTAGVVLDWLDEQALLET